MTKCRHLLTLMLNALSLGVFEFPAIWPEGVEHFEKEVASGVESLPCDPAMWLDTLENPLAHRSTKFSILLFLYFMVLVDGRSVSVPFL